MRAYGIVFGILLAGCCPPMGSAAAIRAGCCVEAAPAARPAPGYEPGAASQPAQPGYEAGPSSQPERRAPPPVVRNPPPTVKNPPPTRRAPPAAAARPGTCTPCGAYSVGHSCTPDGKSLAFCPGLEACLTITPCPHGCKVADPNLPEEDHCQ